MTVRLEVEHCAGESSASPAARRKPEQAARQQGHAIHSPAANAPALDVGPPKADAANNERLSVDPLRGTDRYRLVQPFTPAL